MTFYTGNWLTLVILGLVTEKLSVRTFTSWSPVPTGPRYDVPLVPPLVNPDLTY